MLAEFFFDQLITMGSLAIIGPGGRRHVSGSSSSSPQSVIRLHDRAFGRKLLLNPKLALGEAYMDGTLTIEEGTLYDFLETLTVNSEIIPRHLLGWSPESLLRHLWQFNPLGRARANAAHHYDLPFRLYECFLDRDLQYSCAYFRSPEDDLDTAQRNKKNHIAAKLCLEPGMRVLDIGSGWGGLALHLASNRGADVTGITLSAEQAGIARARAAEAGLSDRVRFHLRDFREERGRYDRIVSVGMFEHVGIRQYRQFFGKIRELLTPDGIAVLHSIGRADGPGSTNPWIRKYIFPGGYSPALSEVLPVVEQAGLWIADIEILRLHYAWTLSTWRQRFQAHRAEFEAHYGERFCRMWDFYLTGAEISFRHGHNMVWQMQLAGKIDAVPVTRDYLMAELRGDERKA